MKQDHRTTMIYASLTAEQWKNTLALLNYLLRCHSAALQVPGIDLALKRTKTNGIHMDAAFIAVENLLFYAAKQCELEISPCKKKRAHKKVRRTL